MSIDRSSPSTPRCGWAVYYAGQNIVVTSWYVETATGRYAIAELAGVLRYLTFTHPGRTVALIAGGVEVAVAVPFSLALQSVTMLVVGLCAALSVAAGALLDERRNPRWMELRAAYRGADVLLLRTRDKTEFEQIRRALIRAVEVNRSPWE
ncbi:MAG TPA: DUF6232 family protein [Actinoplanes sp.]|jgi:hypothetical protein|nr:DUF6232 family protein [Actinoplanes sp.]